MRGGVRLCFWTAARTILGLVMAILAPALFPGCLDVAHRGAVRPCAVDLDRWVCMPQEDIEWAGDADSQVLQQAPRKAMLLTSTNSSAGALAIAESDASAIGRVSPVLRVCED